MDFAFADGRAFFCGLTGVGVVAFGVLEEACAFSVSLVVAFGSGNKNIVTRGSVRSSLSFLSIGNSPLASGCKGP